MASIFITHLLNLRFLCGLLRHLMFTGWKLVFSTPHTTKLLTRHINTDSISHWRLCYMQRTEFCRKKAFGIKAMCTLQTDYVSTASQLLCDYLNYSMKND